MSTTSPPIETELPHWTSRVYAYTTQFPTNFHRAFTRLPLKDYIRLVWIVGAYILLRPYIEKGFQKWMAPDLDKLREEAQEAKEAQARGEVRAGDIRSGGAKKAAAEVPAEPAVAKQPKQSKGGKGATKSSATEVKSTPEAQSTGATTATASQGGEWGQGARRRQTEFMDWWEKQQEEKSKMEDDEEEELDSKEMDSALLKGWDY